MKRLGSLDSLGALMTICPITAEEQSPGNTLAYGSEFQSILELGLDEECGVEVSGQICEKKRRLRVDQVKALEKNFEVENKLEPERKVELAHELGLQPRQVAVWFQNRRARWKTKQLERDYGLLKANYDALKHDCDDLQRDNESLLEEIRGLKSKLEESPETKVPLKKEELMASDSVHNKVIEQSTNPPAASVAGSEDIVMTTADLNHESFDSDSSAILNEDTNSPKSNAAAAAKISVLFESKTSLGEAQKAGYLPQFVKVEEHNFFSGDEACNFFAEEQAPTLHWYCSDHWN